MNAVSMSMPSWFRCWQIRLRSEARSQMVSPQVVSAVTVMLCASSAAVIASVSRWAVRGEFLAMRLAMRERPAVLSAVGVCHDTNTSRSPGLVTSLSPIARSSAGDIANKASLSLLTPRKQPSGWRPLRGRCLVRSRCVASPAARR